MAQDILDQEIDTSIDHTPLLFGKYKGMTPEEISEVDPSYIIWLYLLFSHRVVCSKELYKFCVRVMDKEDEEDYDELDFS